MSIETSIDKVGSGGFGVTGRGKTGGNLTMNKGGDWAEAVLSSAEGAKHDID